MGKTEGGNMTHKYYAIKDASTGLLVENKDCILILGLFKAMVESACLSFNKRHKKESGTTPYVVVKVEVKEANY